MSILQIMLTDGRPYIKDTLPAWRAAVPDAELLIIDDSGNAQRRAWLKEQTDLVVEPAPHRVGYTRAMQAVMLIAANSDFEYILFTEDDFLPINIPDLNEVQRVLGLRPNLAQMSFRRQAWYPVEKKAGGILHAVTSKDEVEELSDGDARWLEHRAYWTANPSVFPRWVAARDWPQTKWSETKFSKALMAEGKKSGVWGHWDDEPITEHIGAEKTGKLY